MLLLYIYALLCTFSFSQVLRGARARRAASRRYPPKITVYFRQGTFTWPLWFLCSDSGSDRAGQREKRLCRLEQRNRFARFGRHKEKRQIFNTITIIMMLLTDYSLSLSRPFSSLPLSSSLALETDCCLSGSYALA